MIGRNPKAETYKLDSFLFIRSGLHDGGSSGIGEGEEGTAETRRDCMIGAVCGKIRSDLLVEKNRINAKGIHRLIFSKSQNRQREKGRIDSPSERNTPSRSSNCTSTLDPICL